MTLSPDLETNREYNISLAINDNEFDGTMIIKTPSGIKQLDQGIIETNGVTIEFSGIIEIMGIASNED